MIRDWSKSLYRMPLVIFTCGIAMMGHSAFAVVSLTPLGVYRHGGDAGTGAAEICAYDPLSQRVLVTNSQANALDILDIIDPERPKLARRVPLGGYGGEPTSVSARGGLIALSLAARDRQAPGKVVFLDSRLQVVSDVVVGALPDMITFTPDGRKVLVANEGEPDNAYARDPEGSVSLIDVSGGAGAIGQSNDARFPGFRRAEERIGSKHTDFRAGGFRGSGSRARVHRRFERFPHGVGDPPREQRFGRPGPGRGKDHAAHRPWFQGP
jgi:hypothetical protein